MAISKEQWAAISEELSHPHGKVELKCGDDTVLFRVEPAKGLKHVITTYVNGEWRGEWMHPTSEVGRKFLNARKFFAHSAKMRAALIKVHGGARCSKANRADIEKKLVIHSVSWPSVTPLRQHYKKLHPDAEVIRIGYAPVEEDGTPLTGLKNTLSKMGLYEEEAS